MSNNMKATSNGSKAKPKLSILLRNLIWKMRRNTAKIAIDDNVESFQLKWITNTELKKCPSG